MTSLGIKFLLLYRVRRSDVDIKNPTRTPENKLGAAGTGRLPSAVSAFESTAMPMAWRPLST